jgi:hypothetical protein
MVHPRDWPGRPLPTRHRQRRQVALCMSEDPFLQIAAEIAIAAEK